MRQIFAVLGISILGACTIEPGDSGGGSDGDGCEEHEHGLARSFAAVPGPAPVAPGYFGYVQLDVGQGDAAVVIAPSGCAALLDGGPGGAGDAVIKPALAALGVTALDFAIVSHYHADHIGGLDEVDAGAGAVPIARVYDRGGSYSTATYTSYASHFSGKRHALALGETLSLCGEVSFRTVAVNGNGSSTTNENGLSVAVVVSHGAFDALVGGDLTGASPNIESSIAPSVGEVEVYKVHHHGSSSSSNATLLGAMLPTVSVIPVGADNTYGHPAPDTVDRLHGVGSEIWQTEDPASSTALGHVEIEVAPGGGSYVVRQGNASAMYLSKGALDTTPPTAPTGLTATAAGTAIELAWGPATDDVGVAGYRIHRSSDGSSYALRATTGATSYTDPGLPAETTFWYQVTAIDAATNESAAAGPVSATTAASAPCTAAITYLRWAENKRELTVRATNAEQPTSTMSLSAGETSLGAMTWQAGGGYYERKLKLSSRPPCVTATASCGGAATQCF
ncbi:MAG TPA: MBL fold metallo-hydrolase [Kofleriaceae bacterium]|nr:MBL fold metallo-hydrolase [Kofleriaceae bacterium]